MIEWCEISGSPTDRERILVRSALEMYLRKEAPAPAASWNQGRFAGRAEHTPPAWNGAASWNGLPASPAR